MGEELDERAGSLVMQRPQSRGSSFDEQLWDELEAQARRRRSQEQTFDRGQESRDAPFSAASPFARQLAMQGTPTLFGQSGPPNLPMPRRPSALAQAPPPLTEPKGMASPFSADSRGSMTAQHGLLAQATDAQVDARRNTHSACSQQPSRDASKQKVQSIAGPTMPPTLGKHGDSLDTALHTPENKDRRSNDSQDSPGSGAASDVRSNTGTAPNEPCAEPMGIDELATLSKRPKRRPVQPHRLAEVMAALDAKGSSRPSSFSSAPSAQGHSTLAAEGEAGFAGFPKAVSEGCEGSQITMGALMGVGAVSQSVPELSHQASRAGAVALGFDDVLLFVDRTQAYMLQLREACMRCRVTLRIDPCP